MTDRPDTYRMASIGTADTAKLIRLALRRAFPKLPARFFSVRSDSYAGGSSVDVSWTDGPTSSEVDGVIRRYAGASFDGMIDLMSYTDHALTVQDLEDLRKLDNSKVGLKYLRVREKKEGDQYHHEIEMDEGDLATNYLGVGDLISWGPNFVHGHRTESGELLAIVAERIGAEFGIFPRITFTEHGTAYFTRTEERMIKGSTTSLDDDANRIARDTAWMGIATTAVQSAQKAIEKFLGFPGFTAEVDPADYPPKLEVVR